MSEEVGFSTSPTMQTLKTIDLVRIMQFAGPFVVGQVPEATPPPETGAARRS